MLSLTSIPAAVLRTAVAEGANPLVFLSVPGSAQPQPVLLDDVKKAAEAPATSDSGASSDDWKLLYDVMRVHEGRVHFWKPHLDRIASSYAAVTGAPMSAAALGHIGNCIQDYLKTAVPNVPGDINVKIISWWRPGAASAPVTEPPALIYYMNSFFPPASWYEAGAHMALLYDARRENPSAKVVQAPLRARATQLQKEAGVFEVLLVHDAADEYLVPEGSRSNYLLVDDKGAVECSEEADILVGTTLRAMRPAIAATEGLAPVSHRRLTLRDLLCRARSLLMLGTSPGALPIKQVQLYRDEAGRRRLERALQDLGLTLERDCPRVRVHVAGDDGGASCEALLELDVKSDAVTRVMEAYRRAAQAD